MTSQQPPSRRLRVVLLVAVLLGPACAWADEKIALGWLERIRLDAGEVLLRAKLDTGAKTSSLHATDIERFERAGERMVRFKLWLDHHDPNSQTITLEKPLARDVTIKLRGTAKNAERASVELEFCLGGRRYESLFTLVNRSKFNYPVLLGRRFLAKVATIDPAMKFRTEPSCPTASPP